METPREKYAYKNDPTYQKAQRILGANGAKDVQSQQAKGYYPHDGMTQEQKAMFDQGRRDAHRLSHPEEKADTEKTMDTYSLKALAPTHDIPAAASPSVVKVVPCPDDKKPETKAQEKIQPASTERKVNAETGSTPPRGNQLYVIQSMLTAKPKGMKFFGSLASMLISFMSGRKK